MSKFSQHVNNSTLLPLCDVHKSPGNIRESCRLFLNQGGRGGGRERRHGEFGTLRAVLQHTFGHNSNGFQTTLVQDCSGIQRACHVRGECVAQLNSSLFVWSCLLPLNERSYVQILIFKDQAHDLPTCLPFSFRFVFVTLGCRVERYPLSPVAGTSPPGSSR